MNRSIEQTYDIKAAPEEVWRALTDPQEIREWSGANGYFIPQPGAMYTLWDGQITGKVLKVEPNVLLSQTWQPIEWTRTDSVVTFMLGRSKAGTKVVLLHENVEDSDYDGTTEGWDIYYLGAIKKMLEKRAKSSQAAKGIKAGKTVAKRAAAKKSKPTSKSKKRAPAKKSAARTKSLPAKKKARK